MCGIVGYIGFRNATDVLIDGLRRLEYRGYDSAGIAVRTNGEITVKRSVGKLSQLEQLIADDPPKGRSGMGHTRWATHGRPSETNAHPHRVKNILLVHNGIIENHATLRKELEKRGHEFSSETDTEIACHLIYDYYEKSSDIPKAIKAAIAEIKGSFAFVIMDEKNSKEIYVAKRSSPLVVGIGEKEMIIASDIPPILPYTKKVICLEDGEFGIVRADGVMLENEKGEKVNRKPKEIAWDNVMAEKGGFKHFMLKEIFEQPKVIADTMAGRILRSEAGIDLPELGNIFKDGEKNPFSSIYIVACGTSWHAALVGKYWIEKVCRVPVMVDLGSEFRYRDPIIDSKTLFIAISQSGETADTLAAVQQAKAKGAKILSICNVVDSSIPRISDSTIYTHAGPEIGVASTKAFSAQLVVLLMFALYLGHRLDLVSPEFMKERIDELVHLPGYLKKLLGDHERIRAIAENHVSASQVLFIARGVNYPVALEGALKLKEISYTHAEGFAAGELKHGPIALVDRGIPVLAIAPMEETYDKLMSNVEEVQARGGDVIALASEGDKMITQKVKEIIWIPKVSSFISPILFTIPLQLFAYYMADHKGTDVDQPRNLAKSVTVE